MLQLLVVAALLFRRIHFWSLFVRLQNVFIEKKSTKTFRHYSSFVAQGIIEPPKKEIARRRTEDRTNHQKYLREWSLPKNLINLISFCVHRLILLFNFHHNGLICCASVFPPREAFSFFSFVFSSCSNHALDTYSKSS